MQTFSSKKIFYGWYIVGATFVGLAFQGGLWTGFGVFFKPLLDEFGGSRSSLSLVASAGLVPFALSQLFIGGLLDRFGPRRVMTAGFLIAGLGAALTSLAPNIRVLYLTYAFFIGLGTGISAMTTASVVVARWFTKRRATALGVAISGYNVGQLLLIPFSQILLGVLGWRGSYQAWTGMFWLLVVPILWWILRDSPESQGLRPDGVSGSPVPTEKAISLAGSLRIIPEKTTRKALRSRSFWLLFGSYFACGFTDFVLYTHFPIFAIGIGVSEQTAANVTGLIGGISILGVISMGIWTDRIGWRVPLTVIYLIRGLAFAMLLLTRSLPMLMAFVIVYGFFHLASTPLTPAAAAGIYGQKSLPTLYGYLLFGHALGSIIGPFVAGTVFDQTGSYGPAFLLTTAVLLAASLCCYFLKGSKESENSREAQAGLR